MHSAGPGCGRVSGRPHRHLYRPAAVRLDQSADGRLGMRRQACPAHVHDCAGAGDRSPRRRDHTRGRIGRDLGADNHPAMDHRAVANAASRLLDGQDLLAAWPRQGRQNGRCRIRSIGARAEGGLARVPHVACATTWSRGADAWCGCGCGRAAGRAAQGRRPGALPVRHGRQDGQATHLTIGARYRARLAGRGRSTGRELAKGYPPRPAQLELAALVVQHGAYCRAVHRRSPGLARLAALALLSVGSAAARDVSVLSPCAGRAGAQIVGTGRDASGRGAATRARQSCARDR